MTIVADRVLFLELLPGHGVPLYVADSAGPSMFLGSCWSKGLRLTAEQWRLIIAERRVPCMPVLSRVFRWSTADVTWRCGAHDPDVLHRYAAELNALAGALGVDTARLGVCGSALYKSASQRSDFDFVVFEQGDCSSVSATVQQLAGGCQIEGVPYHLRFCLPGISGWCDPHFTGPCPLVEAIITGKARPAGAGALTGERVASAMHGHRMPAHYELASGRHLVSFRFGHSGLFEVDDYLSSRRAAHLVTWKGMTSFVVGDGDHHLEVLGP